MYEKCVNCDSCKNDKNCWDCRYYWAIFPGVGGNGECRYGPGVTKICGNRCCWLWELKKEAECTKSS